MFAFNNFYVTKLICFLFGYFRMVQMVGKHAKLLHFGWLYYINLIGASIWLAQAVWLQCKDTPHCVADGLTNDMAVNLCMGSWMYSISGYIEDRGIADRTKNPHFAFLKVAALFTMIMGCFFMLAIKYWLIAEDGRISYYATEYQDKLLQIVDEDASEKKNVQNIRYQYYIHLCHSFTNFLIYNYLWGTFSLLRIYDKAVSQMGVN